MADMVVMVVVIVMMVMVIVVVMVSEFREADMRRKLKECQGHRIMSYKHREEYVEGDKVWYQAMNGNAWLGPAAVLCQRGTHVWLHSQGDIKKVAANRVKPYELVERSKVEVEEERLGPCDAT